MTVIDHPTRTTGPQPDPNPLTGPVPAEPVAASLAVAGRVLLELDPRQLAENPRNPRTDLGDLGELTASIAEAGVLEPLIVTPNDADGAPYVVLFGHRRRRRRSEPGWRRCRVMCGRSTRGTRRSRSRTCWRRTCTVTA